MENTNPNVSRIQHVAKSSSDQLLRKFAEVGSEISARNKQVASAAAKRLKTSTNKNGSFSFCSGDIISNSSGNALADRKLLLPFAVVVHHRKPVALIRRAKIRAKELKNKSFVGAIEKTWRRTVEGASRVLMEKHYNRHKRLINMY
ncbi:hypothetical protein ACJIZ3_025786 [Penstemon smallii]|uniref:Uncharacterized protein n=1 Tax=Penstemon smallii TaxID=265156 RepID=A0ABD3TY77_9LAMI